MSDVSPSRNRIDAALAPKARDECGTPNAPQQLTPVDNAPVKRKLFPDTPARRTAVNRWKAGKRKVLGLVGSPSCLLYGRINGIVLHIIHVVPRTLWRTHPELFIAFQEAVGIIVTNPDGSKERVINLDGSGNQDLMNCLSHTFFDGLSVNKGLGGGVFFLEPVKLDECLEVVESNTVSKDKDYRQMFPERIHEYRVRLLSDSQAMPIVCWGPEQRSYAHLSPEALEHTDAVEPDEVPEDGDPNTNDDTSGDDPSGDDDLVARILQEVTEEDIREAECLATVTPDPDARPPTRWLPDDIIIVVTHLNPVFPLWDMANKLHRRLMKEIPGKLSQEETDLHDKIWPVLKVWFEPPTQAAKGKADQRVQKLIFEGATRRSSRIAKNNTEPAPPPAPPVAQPRPRYGRTEPSADTRCVQPAQSRYDFRATTLNAQLSTSGQSAKRRVDANAEQPKQKKKKTFA
ncbi:hypothetical protein BD626DRAFT_631824 [Schizophyllum amplum]|uniref:Uncharacterized protein n=1 Tax=Schizophyllum amplum TaxID=97359 RepID=A0A550C913_9AGAR|nr:hypothetical protein BD626DRAFT_631824 [Auriculariopsis ampla]